MSTEPPPIEDLIVMAVALHGSTPEVVRGERPARANGCPILKQLLMWTGAREEAATLDAHGAGNHPVVPQTYEMLVAMAKRPAYPKLLVGFGNLGTATKPPAWPAFVAFGLTPAGSERAAELFDRHSEFQSFRSES